jgi:hypothetical protein
MALTKAQLEALKNSLLASQQPIIASTHRELIQNIIDEMYDAQSRGNLLAGVQIDGTTTTGDTIVLIRSGQAYLVPTSLFTEVAGDFVTRNTTQTITGAKTFENELVRIEGINPEIRLRASSNISSIKFRSVANEDIGQISYDNPNNRLTIGTQGNDADIVIAPNGTGKVNLPNIPNGTGESLMRNIDGNIVKGSISVTGIFTPTLTASGLSFTYSVQKGFYTRIGDLVFVNIRIVFSATGTPNGGNLRVNALPFSGLVNEIQRLPVLQMQNSGYTDAQVALLAFEINGNATNGNVIFKNSSIAPLTTYTNCGLIIQGQYKTSN